MRSQDLARLGAAALLFIVVSSHAQTAQPPLSVAALVRFALEQNRGYLAARQRVAEMRALLRQAGVRPNPTIEIETASGRPLGSRGEEEYSAGYFHVFEAPGKRAARIQAAEKTLELAEAEIAERARQLAFEVQIRFVEAIAAGQSLAAIEQATSLSRENHRLAEARVKEGDIARLDGDLLLADLRRSEAQQALATGRSSAALLELRRTVGIDPSDPLTLAADPGGAEGGVPEIEKLRKIALERRPDLKTARILEEQARAEATLARAEGKPDLTASARYARRYSRFEQFGLSASGATVPIKDRDDILAFGLSIPIFTRKRTEALVEAAVSRGAAASQRREYLAQTIPMEVEAAFDRWRAAQSARAVLETGLVPLSQKNLEVVREAYSLGQLRVMDVLNEQRRFIDARLACIEAQADSALALAELERAVGGNFQ